MPSDVWIQDIKVGGGRIIGEGCHWLDFMLYLTGSPITRVSATMVGQNCPEEVKTDKMSITVSFENGSIGTIHYFANGSKSYPKETFELFCQNKILKLDNFKKLTGYGFEGFKKMSLWSQDKGHNEQFKSFIKRINEGGDPLILFEDIENVTLASFAAMESAQSGQTIKL